MFTLTIFCVVLACITATFWLSEWPWGKKGMDAIKGMKYLMADIFFTILIVKVFSLGGLIGTCMGFAISNIISLGIMFSRLKNKEGETQEA